MGASPVQQRVQLYALSDQRLLPLPMQVPSYDLMGALPTYSPLLSWRSAMRLQMLFTASINERISSPFSL